MMRPAVLLAVLLVCACSHPVEDDSPATGMARLAGLMRDKGDVGSSIDFYRRAIEKDPKNLAALKGLGGALEQWGDKQGAANVYSSGVGYYPDDVDLLRGYGRVLLALDQPAEAKKQYEAVLDQDSSDTKSRSGLGVALDYLGEHKAAQKQYERVLEAEPHNLATLNNLAYSYILSNRYDLAIKELEPHVKNPSATAAMRQNLALAYGLAGMDADAERVAKMDLPPEKVRQNMDYYRRQRAEIAVTTAPYAEVGTYATEAMAVAQAEKLKEQAEKSGGKIKPMVMPEVTSPGGTPRFTVRMMGCARPDDVSRLCQTFTQLGLPCVPKGKGVE